MDFVVRHCRRQRWRYGRDVGHRRDLSEGVRHRKGRTVGSGNGMYKAIRVRPSVDFNRLEEVLVVKSPPSQRRTGEGPLVKALGIALAIAIALALADLACTVSDARRQSGRPGLRRRGLHRPQRRAGGRADRGRRRGLGAGCPGRHGHARSWPSGPVWSATRSIIGIGGLAKTVVGFVAGIIGSQFIVARPLPRAFVFFTATVAHAIIFLGLYRVHRPRIRADDVPARSSARPARTR